MPCTKKILNRYLESSMTFTDGPSSPTKSNPSGEGDMKQKLKEVKKKQVDVKNLKNEQNKLDKALKDLGDGFGKSSGNLPDTLEKDPKKFPFEIVKYLKKLEQSGIDVKDLLQDVSLLQKILDEAKHGKEASLSQVQKAAYVFITALLSVAKATGTPVKEIQDIKSVESLRTNIEKSIKNPAVNKFLTRKKFLTEKPEKAEELRKKRTELEKRMFKACILASLDKIANDLEKISPKVALQIDHISDEMEKTADEINYQEFINNTGDIGITARDIEKIVTDNRDYDVHLTGDMERELNNLLGKVFGNRNFEDIRMEGGSWIISFKG